MEAYELDLVWLTRFALAVMLEEKDRADLFQQGLRHIINEQMAALTYNTYSKVFKVTCQREQMSREAKPAVRKRALHQEASFAARENESFSTN